MDNTTLVCNNLQDLKHLKTKTSRLLGFDVGDRRVGVSISDLSWTVASPVLTFDRTQNWQLQLQKIHQDYQMYDPQMKQNACSIVAYVIGIPLLLNGDFGPQAQKVQDFYEKHLTPFQKPFFFWDERLSTHGANRILLEADLSRSKRQKNIDKLSAVFILQGVLDALSLINE